MTFAQWFWRSLYLLPLSAVIAGGLTDLTVSNPSSPITQNLEQKVVNQSPFSLEQRKKLAEFRNLIGEKYLSFYPQEREYLNLLDLPGAPELVTKLGHKFETASIPDYISLLKSPNFTEFIKHVDWACLDPSHLKHRLIFYEDLLKIGLDPKLVALSLDEALDMTFNLPRSLVPYTQYSGLREKSIEMARANRVFGEDSDSLKDYLKDQLSHKKHCYRRNSGYSESWRQVNQIKNLDLLYLIKGYLDFFDDTQNISHIGNLIQSDLADNSTEYGGLVVADDKGKYQFVSVSSENKRFLHLKNNRTYMGYYWFMYISQVGHFHIHAISSDCQAFCGPSGRIENRDSELFATGDLGSLYGRTNSFNPYLIDCVVTKLSGKRFNVDVYFRDIDFEGKNSPKFRVLDLGIYSFK